MIFSFLSSFAQRSPTAKPCPKSPSMLHCICKSDETIIMLTYIVIMINPIQTAHKCYFILSVGSTKAVLPETCGLIFLAM